MSAPKTFLVCALCFVFVLSSACKTETLVTKIDPTKPGKQNTDGVLFSLPETVVIAAVPVSKVSSSHIMNARDAQGRFLFLPAFIAQLFYHALLGLGPTALFSDSRRSVELQARTILRNDPDQLNKLNAIAVAFNSVGIV